MDSNLIFLYVVMHKKHRFL